MMGCAQPEGSTGLTGELINAPHKRCFIVDMLEVRGYGALKAFDVGGLVRQQYGL